MMTTKQVILLFLSVAQCLAVPEDEIKHLPGLNGTVPFRQYSGYLNGGKGRRLFYWFAESEKSPADDPLVLWLNGGPGCSSLEGLFSENGPFRVKADSKSLERDPFSWNTFTNLLFLESPVNVGFSYLDNSSHATDAELYNDDATIDAKYNALLDFFEKYPQLKKHKFYITGESYAGLYIPLLTRRILDNHKQNNFNLQGIAIGNGVYDTDILASSRIEYAYYHGLVGIDAWDQMQSACCHLDSSKTHLDCDYPTIYSNYSLQVRNGNQKCAQMVGATLIGLKAYNFNLYYIYDSCNKTETSKQVDHICFNTNYGDYLNIAEVKEALHVSSSVKSRVWTECNQHVLMTYAQQYTSMDQVFRDIIEKHKFTNVILYNGDADIVCDFLSTQRFLVHHMKYPLKEATKPWMYGGNVAGVASRFTNGLRYYTVHGAGHLAPSQKPGACLAILKDLLAKETIA